MKLAGLVLIGLLASVILGIIVSMLVLKVFPGINGGDTNIWIPILVVMPIAFILGSILTGYFSYYNIEDRWMLLWLAPALYSNLLIMFLTIGMLLMEKFSDAFIGVKIANNSGLLRGVWAPVLIALYWYLMSLTGVGLGYFLRTRVVRWWYEAD